MPSFSPSALVRRPRPLVTLAVAAAAALAALAQPAASHAAIIQFGSPLKMAATEDTAQNLHYTGTNAIQYGTGVTVHTNHDGADTALWNATLPAGGDPTAPEGGQITSIRLEGCAVPATGGPAPLTQIHFQDITPVAGGTHVNVTSQPVNIPTCGQNGASGSTVTSYQPINFCVNKGDYVDFNDEGGFDPAYYPSGVRYRVIGSVSGATMDSFIADNGTDNGATLADDDVSVSAGFASNAREELMLQATLATGPDAMPFCPGGEHGQPGEPGGKPALAFGQTSAGVNHEGSVGISLYCDLIGRPCAGTIELRLDGAGAKTSTLGSAALNAPTDVVSSVHIPVPASTIKMIRAHGGSVPATLVVKLSSGQTLVHALALRV